MLDFGDAQLFGATNYTAILILDSTGGCTALQYRKLQDADGDPIAQIESAEASEFKVSDLGEGPWILASPLSRMPSTRRSVRFRQLDEHEPGSADHGDPPDPGLVVSAAESPTMT